MDKTVSNSTMKHSADQITTYNVTGFVFLCLMLFGLSFHSAILYTYQKVPFLQTTPNLLIIGCVLCDITMLLIGFPFVIASCFYGQWNFGSAWCEGFGFVSTLLGVTSICILVAMAFERFFVVLEKPFAQRITSFKAGMTILSCWGYGLLWATFPLAGWGAFVEEHGHLSCGPDWGNQDSLPRTYNVTIFLLVFVVPVVLISYCYFHIFAMMYNRKGSARDAQALMRRRESDVAITAFLTICTFLAAWMPYTAHALWSMSSEVDHVSQRLDVLAPLIVKSVSVWNPMIYVMKHGDFRRALWEIIFKPLIDRCISRVQVQPENASNNVSTVTTVVPQRSRII